MKLSWVVIGLNFVVTVAVVLYVTVFEHPPKTGYCYNQKVFDQFKGKAELERKLEAIVKSDKATLDSLSLLVTKGDLSLKPVLQQKYEQSEIRRQELTERYTADIWKRINEELLVFGKEKGYDYVFGASGNGSLMYAKESNDVTEEVVEFLNARYK